MNARRTVFAFSCAAMCAWSVLDSIQLAQAAVVPRSFIRSVKNDGFGTEMGQPTRVVKVVMDVEHQLSNGVVKYVHTGTVIPKSTLRAGAVSVLRAGGRLYPALGIALLAADLLIDGNDVYKEIPGDSEVDISPEFEEINSRSDKYWAACAGVSNSPYSVISACASQSGYGQVVRCFDTGVPTCSFESYPGSSRYRSIGASSYTPKEGDEFLPIQPIPTSEPTLQPVTDDDLSWSIVDENLPAEIVDQIYADGMDIPLWEDTISVIPLSGNVTRRSGGGSSGHAGVAPEVIQKVVEDQQNLEAASKGEESPFPDTVTDPGQTAGDELLDRFDEVPPDFEDPEVKWNTEIVDSLPSWDAGIGDGSCPAPWSIEMQGHTISFSYEPACEFATLMRPFVVGTCFIIALYIVVGVGRAKED